MSEPFLDQSTPVELVNPTFRTIVENGSLQNLPVYLHQERLAMDRAFVITDTNVDALYGRTISRVLFNAGVETTIMTMEAGEQHKTLAQVGDFIDQLSEAKAARKDMIIAVGGGVVGDLGGFVASIYNRGVPLVHVPTTLLAMVDSSVGGKTGVDHGGKNKTGSFYQPELVVADPTVLSTLGPRIYTEGFGEIAKYSILDASFLPDLEAAADSLRLYSDDNVDVLGKIIARCVKQKSDVIAADPYEQAPDGRILLNYGHTLGHGLEAAGNYTELLHGEGVAIGMTFAAKLAAQLGFTGEEFVSQQTELLEALGLPTHYMGEASVFDILKHIGKDKKNTGSGGISFVLPRAAGRLTVEQVTGRVVGRAVNDFIAA